MAFNEQETLAALRILVSVAKADGVIHDAEKEGLRDALTGAKLPSDVTIEKLMAEKIDMKQELGKLQSSEAKQKVYEAAVSMVYAKGDSSAEEKIILEEIRIIAGVSDVEASFMTKLTREVGDTLVPGSVDPIKDPEIREKAVNADIRKYGIIAAAMGAFPIPLADIAVNIAVVGLHAKMFHDIGRAYGFTTSKEQIKNLMGGVGVGTGARIAVVSLSKFIPGWGSVVGAVTNFAATYALGRVAKRYYDSQGSADIKELKAIFVSAEKEGREIYKSDKADIENKGEAIKPALEALAIELKDGKITAEQYEKKVSELA